LRPEYPRWKHLIPENPTLEQAREAWRTITRCQIVIDIGEERVIMNQV